MNGIKHKPATEPGAATATQSNDCEAKLGNARGRINNWVPRIPHAWRSDHRHCKSCLGVMLESRTVIYTRAVACFSLLSASPKFPSEMPSPGRTSSQQIISTALLIINSMARFSINFICTFPETSKKALRPLCWPPFLRSLLYSQGSPFYRA